jgi:GlcNAc-P-P-Und epimerase
MIVITGASGLIGRALAARALRDGMNVRLQGRSAEAVAQALYSLKYFDDLQVVQLDMRTADQPQYDRLLVGASSVVHCAGLVHQATAPAAEYDLLNFRATQMVANAAKRAKVDSFIFLSTSAVYGGGPFINVKEDGKTHAETPYAISKLRCEEWLKENQPAPKTVVLRPSLVFGEGDRGNMLSLMKQINKGLYVHISGNRAEKSLIYAGDVATIILLCMEKLPDGYHILNVANPKPHSVIELSNDIAVSMHKLPPPTVPEGLLRAGAMLGGALLGDKSPLTVNKMNKLMSSTTCSVERLVSATGFKPSLTVLEAVRKEVAWAQAEGILSATTELKK